MQRDDVLKVMTFSLRVGEEMLESAVATSDVEDAIRRLTGAFGLERCELSVTLNVITLRYLHPSVDGPITLVKVVDIDDPRFDHLVALDHLSRQVQAGELDIDQAGRSLREIEQAGPAHPRWVTSLAALVSVAAWVVFAGGGLVGAAAGVLAALLIELLVRPITRQRLPPYFVVALWAVCAVSLPMIFAWVGLPIALTPAIVGGIAVGAFAIARSLPFRYAPGTVAVAMLVYLVGQIASDPDQLLPLGTFIAAIALGLVGQLVARLQQTTATIHTATAVYVLVPGVLSYLSMLSFAQGNTEGGVELLTRAVGVAGAIAAGVALGTAAGRSVRAPRPRVVVWRRQSRR